MSDTREKFGPSLTKEQLAYGHAGKPKSWQEGFDKGFKEAWQACQSLNDARIEELEARIVELVEALEGLVNVCYRNGVKSVVDGNKVNKSKELIAKAKQPLQQIGESHDAN